MVFILLKGEREKQRHKGNSQPYDRMPAADRKPKFVFLTLCIWWDAWLRCFSSDLWGLIPAPLLFNLRHKQTLDYMLICVTKPKISHVSLVGVVNLLLPPPLEQTLKTSVFSEAICLSRHPTPPLQPGPGREKVRQTSCFPEVPSALSTLGWIHHLGKVCRLRPRAHLWLQIVQVWD